MALGPMFLTFGAGRPSISGGATNDIAGMVASGASGVRFTVDFDQGNPSHDGVTLNASYMASIASVVQYCNSRTLISGATPVPGIPGFAVGLQVGLGNTYGGGFISPGVHSGGEGYNQASTTDGHLVNVPKALATFGASVANYFKRVGGVFPNGQVLWLEGGNEPNHQKWSDPAIDGGVLATRAAWIAAGSPAIGYKALIYNRFMARLAGGARAANPDILIALGGLGGHGDSPSDVNVWQFNQDMYDARFTTGGYDGYQAPTGIHGLIDWGSHHPYSYFSTPTHDLALAAGSTGNDVTNTTTVASGSNGVNTGSFQGAGTLHLASSATLSYGVVLVTTNSTPALITYTGVSGNDLTGCETVYGGGILATGGTVKTFRNTAPNGARGWYEWVCLTRPILSAGGGHSDALDPNLPIFVGEFGQPCPKYQTPGTHDVQTHSIGEACTALTSACTELVSYSWWNGILSWFCWQDKDESAVSVPKGNYYGIVGVGNNQWVGDTTAFGRKADGSGDLWQTFHDLATQGGNTNAPTVTGISPTHGVAAGGTTVTITGTKFGPATAVNFGSTPATSFTVTDGQHINAVSPAGSGSVDIEVVNPSGTSSPSGADLYTYDAVAGVPTVTGLSPTGGPAAGGTTVTITGTNFTGATAVKFGATSASFSVTDATHISATAPAGTGVARVKVTNPTGTSAANPPFDQYTFTPTAAGLGWGLNILAATSSTGAANVMSLVNGLFTAASSTDQQICRVQPEWGYAQSNFTGTTPGQNDSFVWTRIDLLIDAAVSAGVRLQFVIGYTPSGLRSGSSDKVYPNRDAANGYRDVANYAWSLANRCVTRGLTNPIIEVWNEPSGGFLLPISVSNYTAMLRTVYTAIKTGQIAGRTTRTAYPNVLVGTGGVSPETPGTSRAADQWHAGIIANGGGNSFDWAGHHPYGLECPPTNAASWNQRLHVLPQLRTVLNNAGRADAQIWLTEDGTFNRDDSTATSSNDGGCNTKGSGPDPLNHEVTETMSGTRIGQLLTWWNNNRVAFNLGVLNYYELEDSNNNTSPGDWANHGGIYKVSANHNGVVKTEVHDAYVTALGSGGVSRTAPNCNIANPPDDPTHATPLAGLVIFLIPSTDTVDPPQNLIVKLYRGNGSTLIGTATYNSLYGWYYPLDTTTLADGDYVFAATATNSANLTTTSNGPNGIRARITNSGVGNSAPVGAWVSITGSDHVVHTLPAAAPILVKNDPTVTLEAQVTDDHDTTVANVQFFAGPFELGQATPKPGTTDRYVLTFDSASLPNGIDALTGTATDSGGLTGVWP